ncbi:hypothetical protein AKJ16_DCAP07751 [Drosera capensis]
MYSERSDLFPLCSLMLVSENKVQQFEFSWLLHMNYTMLKELVHGLMRYDWVLVVLEAGVRSKELGASPIPNREFERGQRQLPREVAEDAMVVAISVPRSVVRFSSALVSPVMALPARGGGK